MEECKTRLTAPSWARGRILADLQFNEKVNITYYDYVKLILRNLPKRKATTMMGLTWFENWVVRGPTTFNFRSFQNEAVDFAPWFENVKRVYSPEQKSKKRKK